MGHYFYKVAVFAYVSMLAVVSLDTSDAVQRSQSLPCMLLNKGQNNSMPKSRSYSDLLSRKKLSRSKAERLVGLFAADQGYKAMCTHSDGSDTVAVQRGWKNDVGINTVLVMLSKNYSDADCDLENLFEEKRPNIFVINANYPAEVIEEMSTELADWWFSRGVNYTASDCLTFFQNPVEYLNFIRDISVRRFAREEVVNIRKVCGMVTFYLELAKRKTVFLISNRYPNFIVHEFPYFFEFGKSVADLCQFFNAVMMSLEQEDERNAIIQVQDLVTNYVLPKIFELKGIGASLYIQTLQVILGGDLSPQTFATLEWVHDVFLLFQTPYLVGDIQAARDLFRLACLRAGYYRELGGELSDGDEWEEADRAVRLANE